ncbi:hypothetical protein EDD11_000574 [Mortierella claussenii]|nr:hypothetical protein EDD11_000574 [Mortierella claussenii]
MSSSAISDDLSTHVRAAVAEISEPMDHDQQSSSTSNLVTEESQPMQEHSPELLQVQELPNLDQDMEYHQDPQVEFRAPIEIKILPNDEISLGSTDLTQETSTVTQNNKIYANEPAEEKLDQARHELHTSVARESNKQQQESPGLESRNGHIDMNKDPVGSGGMETKDAAEAFVNDLQKSTGQGDSEIIATNQVADKGQDHMEVDECDTGHDGSGLSRMEGEAIREVALQFVAKHLKANEDQLTTQSEMSSVTHASHTEPVKSCEQDSSPTSSSQATKRSTDGSGQDAPPPKGSRTKREPVKKAPKVYPPRKPRARPAVEGSVSMGFHTDALSTLASAAVAIQDHQGSLSTLTVPQLSPTAQESESSSSPAGPSTTPPDNSSTSTTTPSQQQRPAGRPSVKSNAPNDTGGYRCEHCPGERFGRVHDLKRHQISKHNEMTWPCDFCHRPFVRRDALLRHYSVKAARRDGVHPTEQEENRLQEAKARAKLLS